MQMNNVHKDPSRRSGPIPFRPSLSAANPSSRAHGAKTDRHDEKVCYDIRSVEGFDVHQPGCSPKTLQAPRLSQGKSQTGALNAKIAGAPGLASNCEVGVLTGTLGPVSRTSQKVARAPPAVTAASMQNRARQPTSSSSISAGAVAVTARVPQA